MDQKQTCTLCPHQCIGIEGKYGFCGIRMYNEGRWFLPESWISSTSVDPMEKKPLYHFYPGESIFSVGFWGCNMACPFCQNWQISQQHKKQGQLVEPEQLIKKVKSESCDNIAFTYNEPLIHMEYILEAAQVAREENIKTVLVSNGMALSPWREQILNLIDACNIDLKCFNKETYNSTLKGDLSCVQDFIIEAQKTTHLEVTTLIVPGISDDKNEMEKMSQWLSEISRDIPWHISAYYPQYKYSQGATEISLLSKMLETARKKMNWVYPGNTRLDSNSYCRECGNLLINRSGYTTRIQGLDSASCCSRCGKIFPLVT